MSNKDWVSGWFNHFYENIVFELCEKDYYISKSLDIVALPTVIDVTVTLPVKGINNRVETRYIPLSMFDFNGCSTLSKRLFDYLGSKIGMSCGMVKVLSKLNDFISFSTDNASVYVSLAVDKNGNGVLSKVHLYTPFFVPLPDRQVIPSNNFSFNLIGAVENAPLFKNLIEKEGNITAVKIVPILGSIEVRYVSNMVVCLELNHPRNISMFKNYTKLFDKTYYNDEDTKLTYNVFRNLISALFGNLLPYRDIIVDSKGNVRVSCNKISKGSN